MRSTDDIFADNIRLALKAAAVEVKDEARKTHKYKTNTGDLEKSVTIRYEDDDPKTAKAVIFLDEDVAEYGPSIHEGIEDEYDIKAKNKLALRWFVSEEDEDGQTKLIPVFAKRVVYPKRKKDPFLYDALEEKADEIEKIFIRYRDRALKEVEFHAGR